MICILDNLRSNHFYNQCLVIKKYWVIIGKPVLIQSFLAGVLGSAVMLALFDRVDISAYFIIVFGVFVAHIVFRCIFGEDKQYDYNQDD